MIGARDAAVDDFFQMVNEGKLPGDVRSLCAGLAPIDEELARALKEFNDWPRDAQDEIDALVSAEISSATFGYECAKDPASGSDVELQLVADRITDAEAAARFALELPIDG